MSPSCAHRAKLPSESCFFHNDSDGMVKHLTDVTGSYDKIGINKTMLLKRQGKSITLVNHRDFKYLLIAVVYCDSVPDIVDIEIS